MGDRPSTMLACAAFAKPVPFSNDDQGASIEHQPYRKSGADRAAPLMRKLIRKAPVKIAH
jgi:hypothetical protein